MAQASQEMQGRLPSAVPAVYFHFVAAGEGRANSISRPSGNIAAPACVVFV
jgi:hypothetical protein